MRSIRARFSFSLAFDLVTAMASDAPDASTSVQRACAASTAGGAAMDAMATPTSSVTPSRSSKGGR